MTHDPLCPYKPQAIGHGSTSGDVQAAAPAVACQCDLIANVREDERKGIIGSVELAAIGQANQQAYRDGQRDMLAKCIAAVEWSHDHNAEHAQGLWLALTELRALQDKP